MTCSWWGPIYFCVLLILIPGTFWQRKYKNIKGCVRYTAGITGTGHFGKFGTSIPVPDTCVTSVHQYRYRTLRWVRYGINTGTPGTGKDVCTGLVNGIGTTSMPVCRYRIKVWYDINPVPPHFDIKIRLLVMRSDSELQIFTFRS